MQKPSSCWKGSTDHWWCDVTFRCDSSWIHLKKSHRQSHKQCWGLACRRSMAKHGEAEIHFRTPENLTNNISNYLKHHQTSSNIYQIYQWQGSWTKDWSVKILWISGESIGEYYSEKPFFRWFLINGFPMILLVSDIFRSCFHHWCFHMKHRAAWALGAVGRAHRAVWCG